MIKLDSHEARSHKLDVVLQLEGLNPTWPGTSSTRQSTDQRDIYPGRMSFNFFYGLEGGSISGIGKPQYVLLF